jgi:acetylornithine deacetylase/succinyl-diaminopimelate desuccinylase-like protein
MSESTSALDSAQLHAELDTIFDEVLDRSHGPRGHSFRGLAELRFRPGDRQRRGGRGLGAGLGLDVDILTAQQPDGTDGYPAVVASVPAPEGAPTVLLYAHHDVQPPGRAEDWDTEPFVATRKGDRLFGRGAADDKAGIMVHLTALRLLADRLGVGVTLFFEGEEEAGSPSFRNFLETYRDRLRADVIVVADSGNWAAGTPALTTSLRGMCAVEFEISTLDHAVHSGMYGGVAPMRCWR